MPSSEQLKSGHEYLGELSCAPNKDFQDLLNEFVQTYVFVPDTDNDNDEPQIEELHKRRNFLAAYCKLIVYNIMPTKSGRAAPPAAPPRFSDFSSLQARTSSRTT